MKSKIKPFIGAVVLCIASLTGCDVPQVHKHTEVTRYDDSYHWTICETCNEVLTEKVEHKFNSQVLKDPTCVIKGEEKLSCDCGFEKTVDIDANGHKFSQEYSFDENSHYHSCENCDEKDGVQEHEFLEEIIEEPTPIAEGKKRIYCDICSYEKEETIDKLPLTEETLEIISSELDEHPYIEMGGVYLNASYPQEFTIQKGTGYLKSDKLGVISEISIHLYGYYNNLSVYDDLTGGNLLTGEKESKNVDGATGFLYTYDLNGATSFRIENNNASYDANAYSISIKHTGYVEGPRYEKISLDKALEIGNSLKEEDSTKYIVKGKIVSINGSMVTISDGKNELLVENLNIKENMNPDYVVELKGNIENRDGQVVFTNARLVSYEAAKYSVEVQASKNGSIQLDKYSDLDYEERVNVTIIPDEGYKIKALYVNGEKQNSYDNKASFLVKSNSVVTAEFTKDYGKNAVESEYVFSSYDEGEDKKENEKHKLDSNTDLTISNSFFSSNLTIYESGKALLESKGIIKEITFNFASSSGKIGIAGKENLSSFTAFASFNVDDSRQKTIDLSGQKYSSLEISALSGNVVIESISLVYLTDDSSSTNFVIHSIEMVGTYGDSNLITYGNFDILVDAGTASDTDNVKKAIDTYVVDGVLDLVIISHPHSDHYGGITSGNPFQNLQDVRMMVTSDTSANEKVISSVEKNFPNMEIYEITELVSNENRVHTLSVDDEFAIDFLWHEGYTTSTGNNQSIATMIRYKNTKLFMAGDMEKAGCNKFMTAHPNLTNDDDFVIFKALHHASNGSNETNFINYIKPDFAFVTAGMKLISPNNTPNYSAHPYIDASIRIGTYTNKYYWSGICGQLNITCNGYTATAQGLGRSKDYYVYNPKTEEYIKADREKEKNVTYFESYFYQNAIINNERPNLGNVELYA